jgi:hypothetical protein
MILSDGSDLRVDSGTSVGWTYICTLLMSRVYWGCTVHTYSTRGHGSSITYLILDYIPLHGDRPRITHGLARISCHPPVLTVPPKPPKGVTNQSNNQNSQRGKSLSSSNPLPPESSINVPSFDPAALFLSFFCSLFRRVDSLPRSARELSKSSRTLLSIGIAPASHYPPAVHTNSPLPATPLSLDRAPLSTHTHSHTSTPRPSPCLPTNFALGVMLRTRSRASPTSSIAD